MRPLAHHGGHRMDIRPVAGALGLLYAFAAQAGLAADAVTGDRATAVGVALVIGAVATAAGTLLWRSSQAAARTQAAAMEMLAVERAAHAETRARLDRTEHRLDRALVEIATLRHRLEEVTDQRD